MAKANGYIIAKQFQRQGDNFEVSMDISPDNRVLVFGYGPIVKLVSINTDVNFWFQDRKTLSKLPIFCKETNQKVNIPNNLRVIRDLKWNICQNGKNLIGVVMGESAIVYDLEDINNMKTPDGFSKVFQNDDVMRQGDYPNKFVWYPNSKDMFLCTSSKTDEIVIRDLRQPKTVARINGSSQKGEQKIQDIKFNPSRQHIFSTISKYSTVQIYDVRKAQKPIVHNESMIQNFKSNLLQWQWNGQKLATVFGNHIKLWKFNGENLVQEKCFQHKNAISDFKWLRKYSDYLLVSEMQENIVYGYSAKRQRHDLEILMDPRHSGLKKFITDRNQELVLGLINFEDSKKNHHEMIAVFIDYKSSQPIWSKSKFTKPNQMGLDNELLFAATKVDYHNKNNQLCYPLIYKEVQSSAKAIAEDEEKQDSEGQNGQNLKKIEQRQKKRYNKNKLKAIYEQYKCLKAKIQQKQKNGQMSRSRIIYEQPEQQASSKSKQKLKLKKSTSIQQKQKKPLKSHRSLQKSPASRKEQQNFSSCSSSSGSQESHSYVWITTYREEVEYLDTHYRIQFANESQVQGLCLHNAQVATRIGKNRCAEFWKYIYYFCFPDTQHKYNLVNLYEDKVKIDITFKDSKILASHDQKSPLLKKPHPHPITSLIQSLVDQNQLQTAVMCSILIRNKDPTMLSLQFIEPFLVCYKQLLKALGLTLISTNLSFLAKLNQAIPSPMFRFEIPIGCGQCYRKFTDGKCRCLQVCVLCGGDLRNRLVVGCKICGHMVHAFECEKWVNQLNNQKCPYEQCKHQCFQIRKMNIDKDNKQQIKNSYS